MRSQPKKENREDNVTQRYDGLPENRKGEEDTK